MTQPEHKSQAPRQVRMAIITISDTRTLDNDHSGNYLISELEKAGHLLVGRTIVKDEKDQIKAAFQGFMQEAQIVISSGGTGITGRDVTIPVMESLIEKPMPGFGELFRMLSYQQVKGAAMLSRAVGGLAGKTLLFALPGSLNAVQTGWEGLLRDELAHLAFEVVR
ncbi:MogA/MoaB family molybdenum cofactor biosynthesis protein [Deinococcus roseus]|nr:MogA/MoaB family molybdenum cofactor biosynthesis protein [Deinococcus roseus]